MPYGTSIAVGVMTGFLGVVSFAVSERPEPGHMPPPRTPAEAVHRATPIQAMDANLPALQTTRTLVRNADLRPDLTLRDRDLDRVFADTTAVAAPLTAQRSAPSDTYRASTAFAVAMPVGQEVTLEAQRTSNPSLGDYQVKGVLVGADPGWVQFRSSSGNELFIPRERVVRITAAADAVTSAVEPSER